MTRKQIPKYQMLLRVRDFGDVQQDLFPASSVAGTLFLAVAAAVNTLKQQASKEMLARGDERAAAVSKMAARAALRRQVRAIARTASAVEADGLGDRFRVSLDCSDERLLSQARTILEEAKPCAGTLVAHELPSNFLGQLQAAIDAFERALRERASGRDQRSVARARVAASMEAGVGAVRRLTAIIPNKLDDSARLASWNLARRVNYGRVRRGKAAGEGATSPIGS
jgi:hypothetical protein